MSGRLLAVAFRTTSFSPTSRLFRRSLAVAALGSSGLVFLLASSGRAGILADSSGLWARGRSAVLCQVGLVAVVAPALGIQSLMRDRRIGGLRSLFSSRWGVNRILLTRLLPPVLALLAVILASALPLGLVSLRAGPAASRAMLLALIELGLLAVALVALGALGSVACRELSAAVATVYLIVALMLAAPFLVGPTIAKVPDADALIDASLLVSPLVAASAAVDLDLLRTDRVYRLNPIGQRRFAYPSARAVLLFLFSTTLACYGGAAALLARERRGC